MKSFRRNSNYAERCKVKYFFMGISFMLIVWAGTFALMI
ncbi:putative membrane protein [Escherichia coli 2-156-04_S4_C1]|nr:putative membrane protein [Escherichia coli 2-156-04_S4_C1]